MEPQNTPDTSGRIDPCRHMARWVSALADGSLRGLPRWYTRMHVAGCPRCRAALEALRALRDRLLGLGRSDRGAQAQLSPERQSGLNATMDDIDRQHGAA